MYINLLIAFLFSLLLLSMTLSFNLDKQIQSNLITLTKKDEIANRSHNEINNTKTITLLALYDLSTLVKSSTYMENKEASSELLAAQIAAFHVNQLNLIDGYKLKIVYNDTKCDPGVAVDTFFHAIFSRKLTVPILLGAACSDATKNLAKVVPYWNIVQISHGATSPVLQDRKQFPTLYRIVASEASHNAARFAFIQYFHWHTVTVISQDGKEYTLAVNDLVKKLEQGNITCKGTLTFSENDFIDQLQQLKDMDTRIIIARFSEKVAPKIFCKVYELGMFGADYVWIIPGAFESSWWKNSEYCSQKQLSLVVQGVFSVVPFHSGGFTDSGYSEGALEEILAKFGLPIGLHARESYDAVWTAALALSRSLHPSQVCKQCPPLDISKFDYSRGDIAKRIFLEISNLRFTGVSGPIAFQGSDRVGTTAFLQLQKESWEVVALYSPNAGGLNFTCRPCRPIEWEGDYVPVAQRFHQTRIETIDLRVFLATGALTSLAILLACLFLGFNLYFRKLKLIMLSSPRLNNIAVVGCITVYLGVILLGLDHATSPLPSYFSMLCTAKVYLFAGGFSLAFGSIFAKTYRIHKIFTGSRGGFIKKKFLQDTQLILLVCALLLIDGLILTVWVVVDPLQKQLHNLTQEVSETDRSVIYLPQVELCSCSYLRGWLSLLYGYKGLQLIVGLYMAWETRHVQIPALNDSQYIGMSVYGVVITSCIVVVLANVITDRPTTAFAIISALILTTTTATLCLLFVPKVLSVYSGADTMDPVMHSMGLKMECNTRRFLADDSREKLFRLEVQNRVFRRELLLLRAEARRLEAELMLPLSRTNSSLSLELASFKATHIDSMQSNLYTVPTADSSELTNAASKLPRCSWPLETPGAMTLAKVAPFRSDPHLEFNNVRLTVMDRIRHLIRSKRTELRKTTPEIHTGQIEPRRKFSLTMCLQAQRKRSGTKDIIIDLGLSSDEIHNLLYKTQVNALSERRPTLQHQASYPIIVVNVKSPVLSLQDELLAATSLPMLDGKEENVVEEKSEVVVPKKEKIVNAVTEEKF